MLELLHRKSNALQAVYEQNKLFAECLKQDDIDGALEKLDVSNQMLTDMAGLDEQIKATLTLKEASLTQSDREALAREKKLQVAILENLMTLSQSNIDQLRQKMETERSGMRQLQTTKRGVQGYGGYAALDEFSGARFDKKQ